MQTFYCSRTGFSNPDESMCELKERILSLPNFNGYLLQPKVYVSQILFDAMGFHNHTITDTESQSYHVLTYQYKFSGIDLYVDNELEGVCWRLEVPSDTIPSEYRFGVDPYNPFVIATVDINGFDTEDIDNYISTL